MNVKIKYTPHPNPLPQGERGLTGVTLSQGDERLSFISPRLFVRYSERINPQGERKISPLERGVGVCSPPLTGGDEGEGEEAR